MESRTVPALDDAGLPDDGVHRSLLKKNGQGAAKSLVGKALRDSSTLSARWVIGNSQAFPRPGGTSVGRPMPGHAMEAKRSTLLGRALARPRWPRSREVHGTCGFDNTRIEAMNDMKTGKKLKQLVRERMAKTGEKYAGGAPSGTRCGGQPLHKVRWAAGDPHRERADRLR